MNKATRQFLLMQYYGAYLIAILTSPDTPQFINEVMMGYTIVYPKLLEFFNKHVGEIVNVTDIAKTIEVTEKQIKGAVNTLLGHGHNIESVSRGTAYIYRGMKQEIKPAAVSRRLFEEIGVSKSGAIVIQDADGNLYKAEEI